MGQGFKMMVKDFKVFVMMINHLLITICASFTKYVHLPSSKLLSLSARTDIANSFFPTIMATLGFERKITYALLSVPYLTGFAIVLVTCWYADRIKKRTWPIVINLSVCIVGLAIMGGTLAVPARIIASILMISGVTSASNINLAWIGSSIPTPAPKRAASIACINMVGNLGNVIGGYLFPDSQADRYPMAIGVEGGAAIFGIGGVIYYMWYLKKQNRKIEAGDTAAVNAIGSNDFRYVL